MTNLDNSTCIWFESEHIEQWLQLNCAAAISSRPVKYHHLSNLSDWLHAHTGSAVCQAASNDQGCHNFPIVSFYTIEGVSVSSPKLRDRCLLETLTKYQFWMFKTVPAAAPAKSYQPERHPAQLRLAQTLWEWLYTVHAWYYVYAQMVHCTRMVQWAPTLWEWPYACAHGTPGFLLTESINFYESLNIRTIPQYVGTHTKYNCIKTNPSCSGCYKLFPPTSR